MNDVLKGSCNCLIKILFVNLLELNEKSNKKSKPSCSISSENEKYCTQGKMLIIIWISARYSCNMTDTLNRTV
jgi:hypothetical protein